MSKTSEDLDGGDTDAGESTAVATVDYLDPVELRCGITLGEDPDESRSE